jgi:hypothetical protein
VQKTNGELGSIGGQIRGLDSEYHRRAFLTNGEHPRSDFPTSPPNPGWPEPAR